MDKDTSQQAFQQEYDAFAISKKPGSPIMRLNKSGVSDNIDDSVSLHALGSGDMNAEISLVKGFLQSSNFETGVAGWQISAAGDVEFNDGAFRGTITGATFIGGTIETASTGQRAVISSADNTITFYNSSNAVVSQMGGGTEIGTAFRAVLDGTTVKGFKVNSSASGDIGFEYISSGNYAQAGVNIQMTGATNSGIALNINHDGSSGEGAFFDMSGGARGVLIQNTGAGESLYISSTASKSLFISHTADTFIGAEILYSGQRNAMYIESTDNSHSKAALYLTGNQTNTGLTMGILEIERTTAGTSMYIHQSINTASNIAAIAMNMTNAGAGLMHAFSFAGGETVNAAVGGTQDQKIRVFVGGSTYYIPCYTS